MYSHNKINQATFSVKITQYAHNRNLTKVTDRRHYYHNDDDDNSGALARETSSGAPWIRKCGKLPIRENLVIK